MDDDDQLQTEEGNFNPRIERSGKMSVRDGTLTRLNWVFADLKIEERREGYRENAGTEFIYLFWGRGLEQRLLQWFYKNRDKKKKSYHWSLKIPLVQLFFWGPIPMVINHRYNILIPAITQTTSRKIIGIAHFPVVFITDDYRGGQSHGTCFVAGDYKGGQGWCCVAGRQNTGKRASSPEERCGKRKFTVKKRERGKEERRGGIRGKGLHNISKVWIRFIGSVLKMRADPFLKKSKTVYVYTAF